jgi:hypothetical protein
LRQNSLFFRTKNNILIVISHFSFYVFFYSMRLNNTFGCERGGVELHTVSGRRTGVQAVRASVEKKTTTFFSNYDCIDFTLPKIFVFMFRVRNNRLQLEK